MASLRPWKPSEQWYFPPTAHSARTFLRRVHCMQAIASRAQDTITPAIVSCCVPAPNRKWPKTWPVIPESRYSHRKLPLQGKKLVFVTNNSTKSRKGYLGKFTSLGLNVSAEEIYSSSYAAAAYLESINFPKEKKVPALDLHTGCSATSKPCRNWLNSCQLGIACCSSFRPLNCAQNLPQLCISGLGKRRMARTHGPSTDDKQDMAELML
jgi:hypothetical protein